MFGAVSRTDRRRMLATDTRGAVRPASAANFRECPWEHYVVNRLFYGDNLDVMRSLASESVDVVYLDPRSTLRGTTTSSSRAPKMPTT